MTPPMTNNQGVQPKAASVEEDDEFLDYDEGDGIGCYQCSNGWVHGCMDDLCRGGNEASECGDAIPCRSCNPEGDYHG